MQDFTPEQRQKLLDAPILVMQNVMGVDGAGFINSLRESKAALDWVREAMQDVAENLLVQEAGQHFLDLVGAGGTDLPDTPTLAAFFAEIDHVVALIANDPDGLDYRAFLYILGERVAGAAGTGFLGRGERVSEEEGAVLQALRAKLGLNEE
ncbi:MAG: hypothetical protein SF029_15065 [bacterium]|nr:hypothetical protein [bacterium]